MQEERVLIAGAGGQGIIFAGKVLAQAAMFDDKFVTWIPSYGAEVRGGTAHSMVTISAEEIANPIVACPDSAIIMNQLSFNKYAQKVKERGTLVVDSSMVRDFSGARKPVSLYKKRTTETASKIGTLKVANMVLLGVYIAKKRIVKIRSLVKALSTLIPSGKDDLFELNKLALKEGIALGSK